MTALLGCPACGLTLVSCPACAADMRAGLCQVTGVDEGGRPTRTEQFYCPSGCDSDDRFEQAAQRWQRDHECEPRTR